MNININDISKYTANLSKSRNFITSLRKPGVILPVVLLESTVTLGRTYQAYKRDGFVEARERVTEESLAAIFWLFGASLFGKLIQIIGQKFMNIPKTAIDVGKDNVRQPFKNFVLDNLGNKYFGEKRLASFYFGKVILSLIAACAFIGIVVPKVNQGITKYIFNRKSNKEQNQNQPQNTSLQNSQTQKAGQNIKTDILKPAKPIIITNSVSKKTQAMKALNVSIDSVNEFKTKENKKAPAFGISAAALTQIIQKFDENAIYKLLGTDVGTVSGRTINARNKDERIEILFRDLVSIIFYCFSTDWLFNKFNRHDKYKGNNTVLNPNTSAQIHNHILQKMKEAGKTSMSAEEFEKFALGKAELSTEEKALFEKLFPPKPAAAQKKLFGIFNIKSEKLAKKLGLVPEPETGVIDLDKFKNIINENIADKEKAQKIIELGEKMSQLQPEIVKQDPNTKQITNHRVITASQTEDIFKGGIIRNPDFMKTALNDIFKTSDNLLSKGHPNRLTDKYQYISQKSIETERKNMFNYTKSIAAMAENGEVNWSTMLKANKRNLGRNGIYMGIAMSVSALFLSTIIPKVQYLITKLRTGQNKFPGTENLTK